jgi:pyruvate kinase
MINTQPFSRPLLTTIVATIGPASESPQSVRALIEAGVGVFRFNFSHGDLAGHTRRLATVRKVASELRASIACLGDLQGPKIRVGTIAADVPGSRAHASGGGAFDVVPGARVVLKQRLITSTSRTDGVTVVPVLSLTYQPLVMEVDLGQPILINDGAVRLRALERNADALGGAELLCSVEVGGAISSGKGMNLPRSTLSAPAITERDWECAAWAVAHGLDYLALSFVRSARDVEELRSGLAALPREVIERLASPGIDPAPLDAEEAPWIPIIAKIEMPQAVDHLDSIVQASDGVMVARGDLGVEMDIEVVPVVQKKIVQCCREYGKPCIVATQMLETMIENPIPTRAEASDVANAIFDGADAVMLSAETATGRHPLTVVETMRKILLSAERYIASGTCEHTFPSKMQANHRGTAALAHGAWNIARDVEAKAVVVWSQNGGTARYLSQNRFTIPVFACSSDAASCRRMTLLRGVIPMCVQPPESGRITDWVAQVEKLLLARAVVATGDPIVLLSGRPLGQAKRTNTLALHRVGESA